MPITRGCHITKSNTATVNRKTSARRSLVNNNNDREEIPAVTLKAPPHILSLLFDKMCLIFSRYSPDILHHLHQRLRRAAQAHNQALTHCCLAEMSLTRSLETQVHMVSLFIGPLKQEVTQTSPLLDIERRQPACSCFLARRYAKLLRLVELTK